MSTKLQPALTDWNSVVADNIRAEMARQRWTGRKMAAALGLAPAWVNRRTSGASTLDPNDIKLFADFLNVEIAELFETTRKAPTPRGEGRVLPEMDSNHQPAGAEPDEDVDELADDDDNVTYLPIRTFDADVEDEDTPLARVSNIQLRA